MMQKRRHASAYLALAILMCYLWKTTDCYRLRNTERREGRADDNTPKSAAVQEGRIVFGRVFERGSSFEENTSDNASEDETAYQADFTGWYNGGRMQDRSSGEASWRRMSPSLQCGGDQMKFRVMGPGASQFAVEQGHAPPLPLSQVPPSCGYTMQKNPLSLVMSVPYDGCNMQQEGGNHVLPMRWQGIPVLLLCPGAGAAPNHPPSHHQMPPSQPANRNPYVSDPHVPQYPSYPHHPQYPSMPEPTKAPTTKMNVKKPGMPQFPVYPPYFPYYPSFPLPMTTAKPTTSAPTTAKPAQPPKFPYPYFPPYYPPFPWAYPGPKPTTAAPTTASTTTTKQTTTQTTTKPTAKPQPPSFPPYFPYPPFYPYPPFFPPRYPPYQPQPTLKPQTTTKPTTTPTTTTTTATMTTTKKMDPPRPVPHYHPYPSMPFYPMPYLPPMPNPPRPM